MAKKLYAIELSSSEKTRVLKLLHEATNASILNKKAPATIKANQALTDRFNSEFKIVKTEKNA